MSRRCEYTAASLWALAGALCLTGWVFTISFFGVGAIVALPLLLWLGRTGAIGRAPHGLLLGAAALPLWIAWINRDYQPCPAPAADVADGNWQCGGTNPEPFLWMAAAIGVSFMVIWLLDRRATSDRP